MAAPTAYTEVQIDEDSISLTFITEDGSDGPVIEDTERFTFEELQSLSGEHFTLSLSGDTRESWSEVGRQATIGQIVEQSESGNIRYEVGDVVEDQNPPPWSEGGWLEVCEILSDVRADEYVIQGVNEGQRVPRTEQHWTDETVATANPSYDRDEPVVMAQYAGAGDWYAFPASRLE